MMNDPFNLIVSVVIPVYNVSKEMFEVCMRNVINQTYKNLDIVIVDDGSTNGIEMFCDELSKFDNRIRVIYQENQGVSAARNKGTDAAKGDYIMYVDSDDIVSLFMIESAMNVAKKYEADLVIGLINQIQKYTQFQSLEANELCPIKKSNMLNLLKASFFYYHEQEKLADIKWNGILSAGPYVKLIRADIAKSIEFPTDVNYGEDILWSFRLLNECNNIYIKNEVWYGYMRYSNSSMLKYDERRIEDFEHFINILRKENLIFLNEYPHVMIQYIYSEIIILIRYHFLSKECQLSTKEKCRELKNFVNKCEKEYFDGIHYQKNFYHRALLFISKVGLWLPLFKVWGSLRRIVKNNPA